MKILILALFISLPAFSCINRIPESEAIKAIALEPSTPARACLPGEVCLCYDGMDWETAEIIEIDGEKMIVTNQSKHEAKEAKKLAEKSERDAKKTAKASALNALKNADTDKVTTVKDLKAIVKHLQEIILNEE